MADIQRVLVVSSMYPSADHPVQGIFVHEQVKALRRLGLDVRVVTGRPVWLWARHPLRALARHLRARRERWTGWETHDGVEVGRFPFPAGAFARVWLYPLFYAWALERWLPAIAAEFPYDVVHTHTAFLDGRAGIAAARFRNVPHVLTEHTGPLSTVTADKRMRWHVQAGVDGADRLIAVSSALADDMHNQLQIADAQGRLMILPNGVDTSYFDPAALQQQPEPEPVPAEPESDAARIISRVAARLEAQDGVLTRHELARLLREAIDTDLEIEAEPVAAVPDEWGREDAIHALWVGHHVEVKRVDRLLDAFAAAHRNEPRLRLTLLGNGPLEAAMHGRAQALGVDGVTRFLPSASRSGVRQCMAEADFLVLPSQSETFGVVLIEALAMGLPVMATACGGPQDIVDSQRLGVVVPNDTEGIARGLEQMVRELPSFCASDIRRAAVERFDFSTIASRLLQEYQQLAHTYRGESPRGRT